MLNPQTNSRKPAEGNSQTPITTYYPATLHIRKCGDWRIIYYALNPNTRKLEVVKLRVNRIKNRYASLREAKRQCAEICANINAKLAGGWSPFFSGEDVRLYTKINDVIAAYLSEKRLELRDATLRSYQSFCRMFSDWLDKENLGEIYASTVSTILAIRFLDDKYLKKTITQRTYNNLVKLGRAFFSWAIEKGYSKQNPFDSVKTKRVEKKRRTVIEKEYRRRLFDYFTETCDTGMLLVCNLVYGSLIRPNEIRQLKVKDVNFEEGYIEVNEKVAKTHYARTALLSEETKRLMRVMNLSSLPKETYLIGWNCKPSKKQAPANSYSKRFIRVARSLGLPKECVLYSLRDTGIVDLLHAGVSSLDVMHLADHHDLSITTKYADHVDRFLRDRVSGKLPSL